MAYLLDYSAKQLSGPTIKNAGYAGAVRYIDSTFGGKRTTTAEYASLIASGLFVRLVMEVSIGDANGGYARGVAYAQRALAGANALGYRGVIYFCNDSPTLTSATLWDDYLTGAASVLGWDRVGAYGFANAMDIAAQLTGCKHFWQAGRRSDVRPFVQLWQDNNTQVTVGGITCDRNLILKPLQGEDDVSIYDSFTVTKPDGGTFNTSYAAAIQNLYYATFYGSAFAPWAGPGVLARLNEIKEAQGTEPVPDVDEAAVAAEVARLLAPQLPTLLASLSDGDVARIAQAAADEEDRRDRARLAE